RAHPGERRGRAGRDRRCRSRRECRDGRRVPRRRRQGSEEEARVPHGPTHERAPGQRQRTGAQPTPRRTPRLALSFARPPRSSPNFSRLTANFGWRRAMNDADERIAALAEMQFGVFSREQAVVAGLSERAMSRRVMSGRWVEVLPAVYRVPGAPRTGRQRAMAAVLWGGDESAISHTTAGRL